MLAGVKAFESKLPSSLINTSSSTPANMAIRRERTHSKVTKPEKLSGAHPKAVHSGDFEMRMCFTFYVVFYCSHRYLI